MEQAVVTYTEPRMVAKRPGEITRLSLSHIARGSRGAMFFQWRASRGGAELWHSGMVPHAGPDSRIFREVCALGALLPTLGEATRAPVEAEAAVLWDTEAGWALQSPGLPSTELSYREAVRQAHRVLYRHGVTADFAHPSDDLSAYGFVLVPSLYLISDADAENLRRYVEGGGTLVVSFLSGVADEHARPRTDVPVPDSPGPHAPRTDAPGTGAALAGLPAITRHRHGGGTALYLSTRLTDGAYTRLLGLEPVPVERVRRGGWLFTINHGDEEQEGTGGLRLSPGGYAVQKVQPGV